MYSHLYLYYIGQKGKINLSFLKELIYLYSNDQ